MKSINDVDKALCTGCGACYNKCPVNAIQMVANDEGFLYPTIDSDKCVDCGQCYNVCPIDRKVQKNKEPDAYAVWCDYETRLKSSSGGFFSVLANYVLENGGAVCGAKFTADYNGVYHEWVESKKELSALRGSKYLQSDTRLTFKRAKKYLDQKRWVLYTGCPCQIAGLKNYLGKEYETLILVDIVCHGVPSPSVYRSYIHELANGKEIKKMDFREKEFWGWGTATSLFMKDGSVHRNDCFRDPYWVAFLSGMITRKCCEKCPYTEIKRVGDFTIGDFWGVKTIKESLDDSKGTSLVLVNNGKAAKLFKMLKNNCELAEKVNLADVLEIAKTRNGQLLHPTRANPRRDKFFIEFLNSDGNFADSFKNSNRYDIGYVGWWDSINYGSALTSFAMNRTLKKLGKTVIMLEHGGIKPNTDTYGLQFARRFYVCSKITDRKDFGRFNSVCDTFLVGSDQLWNWWNIRHNHTGFFFLDFVAPGHKRIAYATSFGKDDTDFPNGARIRIGYNLSKFDAISVRERSGVDVCKNEFGVEATHVLDPVFLCDMDSYNEVLSVSKVDEKEDYVFSYILDPTDEKVQAVKNVAKRLGLPYKIAVDAMRDNDTHSKEVTDRLLKEDPNVLKQVRIEDWLKYIANASYVVTDSFHGFCFSIIFGKQVIAYVNQRRGSARFESIAHTTGLEDRLITSHKSIESRRLVENKIDYKAVNARLQPEIERSMAWLKSALNKPIRKTSTQELLLWKCIEHDKKIYEENLEHLQGKIDALMQRVEELEGKLGKKSEDS